MKNEIKPAITVQEITGARLEQMRRDGVDYPAAIFKGEKPKPGVTLRLVFSDTTYSGVVFDATEAKGVVTVQFVDGLTLL